jgi:hypothetical protein
MRTSLIPRSVRAFASFADPRNEETAESSYLVNGVYNKIMFNYIRGWRRQLGIVTLVITCGLFALWALLEIQIMNDPDPLIDSANIMFVIIGPLALISTSLLFGKP